MAVLVVDSARSSYRYATTTRRVLDDYAALGAEGVSNRLQSSLANRFVQVLGVMPAPRALRDSLAGALAPAPSYIAHAADWSADVVDGRLRVIRYDTTVSVPVNVLDSLRVATARLQDGAYLGMVVIDRQLIVFVPTREGIASKMFSIRLGALSPALSRFLSNDPVLPRALTRGSKPGNDIGVTLSIGNVVLARRGIEQSPFESTESLGPMFAGMTVQVRLAERLAPMLIIGGVPKSRLPFFLIASALTIALIVVMVVQLRQRERLARLREDFVAGTSHELRTPLAQIRLFAETLRLERVRSEHERNRALVIIEREARRLEHLVENMLHVSRAERGTLRLAPEPLELGSATSEIVTDFVALAEKAGVSVRAATSARVVSRTDPGAWRQIVLNLLDNAVRYGGRGAQVNVVVDSVQDFARLSVSDNGPGVPVEDREKIWHRFWRGEAGRAAGMTVTGIGLATVSELVAAHGGKCSVHDAVEGGARFEVLLPLEREAVHETTPEWPAVATT